MAASERQLPAASGSSGAAAGAEEAGQEDGVDALDAFMSNVETQIEQDKVHSQFLPTSLPQHML